MASFEKFEDLNLSLDEFKALDAVVSNDHFKQLLTEYAEKISKSEVSSSNSSERSHSETETGMRVDPGYVIKGIASGGMKIFVNVCKSETIGKPSSAKQVGRDGKSGLAWTLPHSFTQPVEDSRERCKVFDCVVHPDTYRMAETNGRFKKMLNEMAIEGIDKEFGVHIEPNRLRFPKMKYKGVTTTKSHLGKHIESNSDVTERSNVADDDTLKIKMARGMASKTDNCSPEGNSPMKRNERGDVAEFNQQNGFMTPKFTLSHNCNCGTPHMPSDNGHCSTMTIRVAINLPLLNSATELTLDIFEQKICLISEGPNKYKLEVVLPYPVDEDQCHARFVKSRRSLNITMPVLRKLPPVEPKPKPVELVNEDDRNECIVEASIDGSTLETELVSNLEPSVCNITDCKTSSKTNVSDCYEAAELEDKSTPSFPEDSFMLPEFSFRQDDESISFIFHVANVNRESVSVVVTARGLCFVRMMVTDETALTVHYSCCLKFDSGCCFRDEGYTVSTSDDNVVVVFIKDESCRTIWNHFWAGVHLNSLEKHDFVTVANLKKALDGLDDEREEELEASTMQGSAQHSPPTLQVTQMDEKGLVILMQQPERKGSSPDSESEIVVIHDKSAPKLHGILKQRTMSESSELSGAERQTSTATCSDADDSDCSPDGGSASLSSSAGSGGRVLKKSVSFNDRVDRALFQANQSVSSMHTVLKNRRRRARKRDLKLEQKEVMKEQRRRRRSSGSLSMEDSGDERLSSSGDVPVIILPGELKEPSRTSTSSASMPTSTLSLPEIGKDPKNLSVADRSKSESEITTENSPDDNKIETVSDGGLIENNALLTNVKILNGSETLRTKENCFEEDYGYETLRADNLIKSDDSFCDKTAANNCGINNFDLKKSYSDTDSDCFVSPPSSANGLVSPSTRRDLRHFSSEQFAFEVCETVEGCGSGDGKTCVGMGGKGPASDTKLDVGLINSLMFELDID